MRNESGREEEKSPNMKHCFLSGRARAGINCQWSHFRAMSVYLYWLWTDHLAGASRSEARRASRLWLTREEPCNDTGFLYSATVSRDLVWGGPARAQCGWRKGCFSQLALSLPNRLRLKVMLPMSSPEVGTASAAVACTGEMRQIRTEIINWNLTTLKSNSLDC